MKKLLSLVLVCAMTIALVGCGQKAERVDNGSGSDKSSAKKIGSQFFLEMKQKVTH